MRTGAKVAVAIVIGLAPVGFILLLLILVASLSFPSCNIKLSSNWPRISVPIPPPAYDLFDLIVSPDGTTLLATDSGVGDLEVIDIESGATEGSIHLGNTPTGLALSSDGKEVWVAETNVNNSQGYVVEVDTASRSVAAKIPVGSGPTGVAVSPNGQRVYVADSGYLSVPGRVSVIDTSTLSVVATVTVGFQPTGLALTPDGSQLWVVNSAIGGIAPTPPTVLPGTTSTSLPPESPYGYPLNGSVSIIDTSTNAIVGTVTVGGMPFFIAFNPSGTYAYAADKLSCDVAVISTRTREVTADIPTTLGCPLDVAVSSDGHYLVTSNGQEESTGWWAATSERKDSSVDVIDLATGAVAATVLDGGPDPTGIAVSPNGSVAYVTDAYGPIIDVVSLSGGEGSSAGWISVAPTTTVPPSTTSSSARHETDTVPSFHRGG